jgi:hypothetical protein
MGLVVQVLCGYVTLPLYALVTQVLIQPYNETFWQINSNTHITILNFLAGTLFLVYTL